MESVGRLAGGIAHDFNNLLAVISGYSESLLRRLDEHDPLYPACAEIQAAADRGASLTRQLLAFSRSQAIQPRDVDVNRVVANVCRMLRRVISDKIDIRLESLAPDAIVRADDGQLEQVLMNLALNARDAMPNGGRLTIRIEPPAADARGDAFVRLIVRDTGCGMEPELRSRIFEPFFTTKEGKGTGLGLSIVYGIVQQFGGRILVESELGKGSTFEILLPSVA
jgi:signal transduction histidine kinase